MSANKLLQFNFSTFSLSSQSTLQKVKRTLIDFYKLYCVHIISIFTLASLALTKNKTFNPFCCNNDSNKCNPRPECFQIVFCDRNRLL